MAKIDTDKIFSYLKKLKKNPPHFIIIEGGTKSFRQEVCLFWACLVNCLSDKTSPCGKCQVCESIKEKRSKELLWFEGDDIRSIKKDEVYDMKNLMSQIPEGCRFRVFVFSEANKLTLSAGNSMLKLLEEPLPYNLFIFSVPNRFLLLPTIVSRSYVFTLGWGMETEEDSVVIRWTKELLHFWKSAKGLFQSLDKEKINEDLVIKLSLFNLRHLMFLLTQKESIFTSLISISDTEKIFKLINLFNKSLELSQYSIKPAHILQWLGINGYSIINDYS